MEVRLCYKDKNTSPLMIHTVRFSTVKKAINHFNFIKDTVTKAYLEKFDGFHWGRYKTLKR